MEISTDRQPDAESTRWAVIAIVLLGAALAVIRLAGPPDLMDNEQQLQSAYVMDAMQNGHWLCQRDESGDITSKPPMYTWLAAVATLPMGRINRLSMCLPSVLGNIALALLLLHFGRKEFGGAAGFLAAAVYLLSYPGARQIGLARMDGLFPLTTTLAALAAFMAWRRGGGWIWFWIAAAAATLTKGPVALLIGAAGLVAIWWEARSGRPQKLRGGHWVGVALFVLIALGWFATSCAVMGRPVYQKLILDGLLAQGVKTHNGHWPGSQFYAPPYYLLSRFFPWSVLMCVGLWRIWRQPADNESERRFERFVACWFLIGLIPFCIAPHQRADLINPLYPPAALLAGREAARLMAAWGRPRRRLVVAVCMIVGLSILVMKYDVLALRKDESVRMTVSARDLARNLEQQVGINFPLTHANDVPYALQFYLNTMRPTVTYGQAMELLEGPAPAFVVACEPGALRAMLRVEGLPLYDLAQSETIYPHHSMHVLSNRPILGPDEDMGFAEGDLRVETHGLRWLHAAERDFTFAGKGSAVFSNEGKSSLDIRVKRASSEGRDGERKTHTVRPGEKWMFEAE